MQTKKTESARESRWSDTGAASGTKKWRFLAPRSVGDAPGGESAGFYSLSLTALCQKRGRSRRGAGGDENNGSRTTPVIPTDYEDNKMKKDSLATLHNYDNN